MINLEEKIKKIISENLGVSLKEITSHSHLVDDLGASSVEIADLLVSLEEKFKLNLTDEEKERIKTVGQLINLVASQVTNFENEKP